MGFGAHLELGICHLEFPLLFLQRPHNSVTHLFVVESVRVDRYIRMPLVQRLPFVEEVTEGLS